MAHGMRQGMFLWPFRGMRKAWLKEADACTAVYALLPMLSLPVKPKMALA